MSVFCEVKRQSLARARARKGRGDALKSKRDTDLQGVLTADQFTKMKALRDKKKDDHKEGKKAHQE